jgi:hypothetical protein
LRIGSAFQRSAASVASTHSVELEAGHRVEAEARAPYTRLASSRRSCRGFVRPPSWIAISRSGWNSGPLAKEGAR